MCTAKQSNAFHFFLLLWSYQLSVYMLYDMLVLCVWLFFSHTNMKREGRERKKKKGMKWEVHFFSDFSVSDSFRLIKRYGSLPWTVCKWVLCTCAPAGRLQWQRPSFPSVWKQKGKKRKNRGRFQGYGKTTKPPGANFYHELHSVAVLFPTLHKFTEVRYSAHYFIGIYKEIVWITICVTFNIRLM